MKIYFAGAIRGGRQDASTYHAMIAHLQTHGEVLTEHVGNKALSDGGEHDLSDKEIHARDLAWLEECDAVVAEVTTPSLGVGYELGVAEKLGKQILCLFDAANSAFRLSAMLSGNPRVTMVRYQELKDAIEAIDLFIEQNR
jgi:2'-deoxynucleoside 5'-phosphate N-hydrolase